MKDKVVNNDHVIQRESFTELLGQLANKSSAVVHDEIELVIQRIREKERAVRGGVLTVVIGSAISFIALMSLCAALIIELSLYMAPVMATLVTGLALAFIGVFIIFIGRKQLKESNLKQ